MADVDQAPSTNRTVLIVAIVAVAFVIGSGAIAAAILTTNSSEDPPPVPGREVVRWSVIDEEITRGDIAEACRGEAANDYVTIDFYDPAPTRFVGDTFETIRVGEPFLRSSKQYRCGDYR